MKLNGKISLREVQEQEAERKKARAAESRKRYYQNNKEKCLQWQKQWREDNAEHLMQYYQDYKVKAREHYQAHKEEILEQQRQYRQENKEKLAERAKQNYQNNKEKKLESSKQYRKTQYGRASNLCKAYNQSDKKYNRGKSTLTPQWIVEHIFPNGCLYCGERDWRKLGCDRVDNELPHTPDNVVCCCTDCNKKRHTQEFDVFLYKSWRTKFANNGNNGQEFLIP